MGLLDTTRYLYEQEIKKISLKFLITTISCLCVLPVVVSFVAARSIEVTRFRVLIRLASHIQRLLLINECSLVVIAFPCILYSSY